MEAAPTTMKKAQDSYLDKIFVFQRACSELSGYKQGFRYHYAEPSYLMLAKWIAKTFETLPENVLHRVVIGACDE
ncbi:hypothetical protein RHSIM_Rhsim06G0161100 [Rhododendron simsii]|uniref:Uncharacterized protein n=1 Tax=Rhododendron simsii TaxID=118357 RepID=A0A834LKI0_RHOSS|nr:hypothetical protein RHSIM_Rhsim06G0161100 [Rhododendron simsii]